MESMPTLRKKMRETAVKFTSAIENTIFGLEIFPERGAFRKTSAYADKGCRQILFKNYIIIYKVHENKKEVHIVTIQHSSRNIERK